MMTAAITTIAAAAAAQAVRSNFFVVRLTWEELASRFYDALRRGALLGGDLSPPCWDRNDSPEAVMGRLVNILKSQSSSVYGSKLNDLKARVNRCRSRETETERDRD
jgi:hypothetical protein